MDDEEIMAVVALVIIASEEEEIEEAGEKARGTRRRLWSREWLLRREEGSQSSEKWIHD